MSLRDIRERSRKTPKKLKPMRQRHCRNSPARSLNPIILSIHWPMNTSSRGWDNKAKSWQCVGICWDDNFQRISSGLNASKTIQTLKCSVCSDPCTTITFPKGWKPGACTRLLQTETKVLLLASSRWTIVSGSYRTKANQRKIKGRPRSRARAASKNDSLLIKGARSRERHQQTKKDTASSPLTRKWPIISRTLLPARAVRPRTRKLR